MSRPFALILAWREFRASWRRIGLYMGAIALGVAALVAVNSVRANVLSSIRAEARTLLGADLRLESGSPFAPPVRAVFDSLAAEGVPTASITRLGSMVLAPKSGKTRLLQVQAVEGGYPFYGVVETEPAGLWPLVPGAGRALVDPAVLVQLDAAVGDTLVIGTGRFTIAGTIANQSGDVGVQTAIGPRIYIPADLLPSTGLIGLGSLVRYQVYFQFDEGGAETFLDRNGDLLRDHLVDIDTAEEQIENLTERIGSLGRFLALVGLMAMLLGGIGVASAVHVFIESKISAVAVLRCLGATQRSVFLAYLLQTGLLGLAGAAAGAAGGLAVQAMLPAVLSEFLPVDVAFAIHWPSVLAGLVIGAWVSLIFALIPLLAVRDVAPLQALRRHVDRARSRRDPMRRGAYLALGATIALLSIWQAPSWKIGAAFAAGIATILGLLWALALLLVRVARHVAPGQRTYVVRQGIANLFRPRNQTVAVTLALGFGIFLVGILYLVQHSILDRFHLDAEPDRPNLLFFDVQPDQKDGVAAFLAARGVTLRDATPLVPARIAAVNGRSATELLADTTDETPRRWVLRREYRNTYRASLAATETLVAGEWWDEDRTATIDGAGGTQPSTSQSTGDRIPGISLEVEFAKDLGVSVGDRITWDVQGLPVETRVASLRRVDWARFAPNFFVVFEPGVLEDAPQSLIALARVPGATERAELQRELVERFPNISVLDLALVQETVDGVLSKVALAVRFLALFTIAGGFVVLIGALATSRHQRVRESVLLRTLGASRAQVRWILVVESLALGALAGLAGTLLAGLAAWPLVTAIFELDYSVPVAPFLAAWVGMAALTTIAGLLNGRDVLRRSPLAVLRDTAE